MNTTSTPKTICLIDDDNIYQFAAKRMIELVDPLKRVITFFDGAQALRYFSQQELSREQLPDIIFLDINMPLMNGWDFLDAFTSLHHQIAKNIKIYMVSSSVSETDKEKSRSYEIVKDYIHKPLMKDTLQKVLHAVEKEGLSEA